MVNVIVFTFIDGNKLREVKEISESITIHQCGGRNKLTSVKLQNPGSFVQIIQSLHYLNKENRGAKVVRLFIFYLYGPTF